MSNSSSSKPDNMEQPATFPWHDPTPAGGAGASMMVVTALTAVDDWAYVASVGPQNDSTARILPGSAVRVRLSDRSGAQSPEQVEAQFIQHLRPYLERFAPGFVVMIPPRPGDTRPHGDRVDWGRAAHIAHCVLRAWTNFINKEADQRE